MLNSIVFMMFYVETCKTVKFCLFWVFPHTLKMLSGRWIQRFHKIICSVNGRKEDGWCKEDTWDEAAIGRACRRGKVRKWKERRRAVEGRYLG